MQHDHSLPIPDIHLVLPDDDDLGISIVPPPDIIISCTDLAGGGVVTDDDHDVSSSSLGQICLPSGVVQDSNTGTGSGNFLQPNAIPNTLSPCSSDISLAGSVSGESASPRRSRKRALSLSPFSLEGFDFNSLIRTSPTSLVAYINGSHSSRSGNGSYGHLDIRRRSSSSMSINSEINSQNLESLLGSNPSSTTESRRTSQDTHAGGAGTGVGHWSPRDRFGAREHHHRILPDLYRDMKALEQQGHLTPAHRGQSLTGFTTKRQSELPRQDGPQHKPRPKPSPSPQTLNCLNIVDNFPVCNIQVCASTVSSEHSSNNITTHRSTRSTPSPNPSSRSPSPHKTAQKPNPQPTTSPATQDLVPENDDQLEALLLTSYQCRWLSCNTTCNGHAEFVGHIEKQHVNQKPARGDEFVCFWQGCLRNMKPFNARYKLLIHMRTHSGEKPNKCPYDGCMKAFSRLENLKIHVRSHTGERPYICQYQDCQKAFSNSSDRAKHQRTHIDTKPYACQVPGCTKRYTDPSSLRKHIKGHCIKDVHLTKKLKGCHDGDGESDTLTECLTIQPLQPKAVISDTPLEHRDSGLGDSLYSLELLDLSTDVNGSPHAIRTHSRQQQSDAVPTSSLSLPLITDHTAKRPPVYYNVHVQPVSASPVPSIAQSIAQSHRMFSSTSTFNTNSGQLAEPVTSRFPDVYPANIGAYRFNADQSNLATSRMMSLPSSTNPMMIQLPATYNPSRANPATNTRDKYRSINGRPAVNY